jgi:hypothetical protein
MAPCRHQRCRCEVQTEGQYCSEACQDIAQEEPCMCGHGVCPGIMGAGVNPEALP